MNQSKLQSDPVKLFIKHVQNSRPYSSISIISIYVVVVANRCCEKSYLGSNGKERENNKKVNDKKKVIKGQKRR